MVDSTAEDGRKREVRAQLFGSKWSFISRCQDEEDWTEHEAPSLEEILFNKYQRKHGSWDHVQGVRKLIEAKSPKE